MTGNQSSNRLLIVKGKDFESMTNPITEDKTKRRTGQCEGKTEQRGEVYIQHRRLY